MQATNPGDRDLKRLDLKPVHLQSWEKPVSDRAILQCFRYWYHQTGRCDSLAILAEVARLAYKRQLVSPKQAQMLLEELEEIESKLPPLFTDLWVGVTELAENGGGSSMKPSEARFRLRNSSTPVLQLVERLMAIAENHPDFPSPGVFEGAVSCDIEVNRVDNLRYYLSYLKQALSPQRLEQSLSQQPELTRTTLEDAINQLQDIAITFIPRLRDNIARKAPQLNCPEPPKFDPNLCKTSMKPEEFRRRLENGERHFERVRLSCVDLRGLDLNQLVLTDSELTGCDLSYASLLRANLSGTILDRTNLTNAFLDGANLFQASLIGCNLSHSRAIDVNFSHANLSHANLTWANLSGANLSSTNLTEVNLSRANLEEANFEHSCGRDQGLKMLRLSVGGRIISLNSPRGEKGSRQIS